MISAAVICLALNVYAESRGEVLEGQLGVAHVTVNRSQDPRYPSEICDVVYQPEQFSWTGQPLSIQEPDKLTQALFVSASVMLTGADDPTNGATHFYSGTAPSWAKHMEVTAVIGAHTFLKEPTP